MNGPFYKRELLSYFRTPIAYVFIGAFHLAVMISSFFINGLLDTDQADLQPFFGTLPWLLLFLVPGIGMRSWAEENHKRTIELTLTLPCSSRSVLLSKFLAAWTVIGIGLALTFPLALTIAYLGDPDWAALATAYLGAWLMAGSLLAVATLCSVVSRMQVVSFVLSMASGLVLLVVGWGVFSDLLRPWLPLGLVDAIAYLGVITHYEALSRGVLPLQDIAYFLLLGSAALWMADFLLSRRGELGPGFWRLQRRGGRQLFGLAVWLGLFLGNSLVSWRLDLSENRSYSIGEQSLAIARDLKSEAKISFFFSRSLPEVPPFMKQYAFRVKAVLEEYVAASGGRLSLVEIDPEPDTAAEDAALAAGLKGLPGPSGALYLGVSLQSGGRRAVVPYLDPGREDLLEYEIAKALIDLSQTKRPRLGIVSTLKMQDYLPGGSLKRSALLEALQTNFEVDYWGSMPDPLPEDLSLLMLVHPQDFDRAAQESLSGFLRRGGRALLAIDPFSRSDLIQKYGRPQLQPGGEMRIFQSQASEWLAAWGIRFDPTKVVGDAQRAANINLYGQTVPHPLFMKLQAQDFGAQPFLKNLKEVFIAEGGKLELDPQKPLSMEVLLRTSGESGLVEAFPLSFQDPQPIIAGFRPGSGSSVVAALFRGQLPGPDAQVKANTPPSEFIVIADADFLDDRHATRSENRGGQVLKVPRNDNINFVLNSLEYLAGSSRLLGIRTAGVIARPFHALRALQTQAEERWRAEEKALQERKREAQKQLGGFYSRDAAGNRLPLKLEELRLIKQLRLDERETERRLRNVRVDLREDSRQLFHRLISANFAGPLALVALGGFGFSIVRYRRWPRLRVHGIYLALPSVAIGLLLSWSMFLKKSDSLRAVPVFETLFDMEDLAGIEKVIITEEGKQATLVKGPDAVWRLEEAEMKPINADRLSRLLYDMSEAKIVRRLTAAQGKASNYGLDQGRTLAFAGRFHFKMRIGKQQPHGGFLVQVEGQPFPYLIDDFLHTQVNPEFWLMAP